MDQVAKLVSLPESSHARTVNAISALHPYKHEGLWVFDDPDAGLRREPFVFGIDKMIDRLVTDIPEAELGFRLILSPTPFPGYTVKLEWRRPEYGGLVVFSIVQIFHRGSSRTLRPSGTKDRLNRKERHQGPGRRCSRKYLH